MRIRKLKPEDAPFMLEWMHDDYVVHDLATDFSVKNEKDCRYFIEHSSGEDLRSIHLAIVDDSDEYMGTVSLKNIDRIKKRAEFAITVRRKAMGKGYGKYAMDEMLRMGFEDSAFLLKEIYWCVDKKNHRARRFYDKHGYKIIDPDEDMKANYIQEIRGGTELVWYSVHGAGYTT